MHGFNTWLTWLCSIGWRARLETHRNLTKHGHGGHDQQFYTMRYKGYYSLATVTSFAQALDLLSGVFKSSEYRTVVLVMAKNWDWESLFKPYLSSNAKYYTRPLAWQYIAPEDDEKTASARYKDWGDASQYWLGEEGKRDAEPLHFLTALPEAKSFRPRLLPLQSIATEQLCADVRAITSTGVTGSEEKSQMEKILSSGGDLAQLVTVTGGLDEGGLPGKPGYARCKDKFGKESSRGASHRLTTARHVDIACSKAPCCRCPRPPHAKGGCGTVSLGHKYLSTHSCTPTQLPWRPAHE